MSVLFEVSVVFWSGVVSFYSVVLIGSTVVLLDAGIMRFVWLEDDVLFVPFVGFVVFIV